MKLLSKHYYLDTAYKTIIRVKRKTTNMGATFFLANVVESEELQPADLSSFKLDQYVVLGYEVNSRRFIDLGSNLASTELAKLLYN